MSEETKESKFNTKIFLRYGIHLLITLIFAAGVAWFSNEIILEKAWNERLWTSNGGRTRLSSVLEAPPW